MPLPPCGGTVDETERRPTLETPVPTQPLCPSCAAALVPPLPACPRCDLPLTGPVAARLWQVDQALAALQAERGTLLARLRGAPVPARVGPVGASPVAPLSPGSPVVAARAGWTGQQLLLWSGVLLVLVAAAVFLAVAWDTMGVGGQAMVMTAVTLTAGAVSLRLADRGVRAGAGAVAVLTAGLAWVDVVAAYSLDLAGLGGLDEAAYLTGCAALLATAFAVLAMTPSRLPAYQLAAVGSAALVPLGMVPASDAGVPAGIAVALVAAAGFAAAVRLVPAAWSASRIGAAVAGAAYLAVGLLVAVAGTWASRLEDDGGLCAAIALGTAVVLAAVARLHRGIPRTAVGVGAALVVAPTTVATLTGLAWHGGTDVLTAYGAGCAVLAAAAAGTRRALDGPAGWLLALGHAGAAAGLLALIPDDGGALPRAALCAVLVAVAASAAVAAVSRPSLRVGAAPWSGAAAVLATVLAPAVVGPRDTALAVTVVAVAVLAVAAWRRGRPEEAALAAVAVSAVAYAALLAADGGEDRVLAGVLGAAGVTALAYALLPHRGWASVIGILGCSASTWTLLQAADVTTVEAYSLPLAALALLVGGLRARRYPGAPSWTTIGPGLSAALLPSATVALDDDGLLRPLTVLAVAVLYAATGAALRSQAPLVTGTVAATVVALSQTAPYAVGLPRWLSLGAAGVALLAVGIRYEQRRRDLTTAATWVGDLR